MVNILYFISEEFTNEFSWQLLTHFWPTFLFHRPWKHQKTLVFMSLLILCTNNNLLILLSTLSMLFYPRKDAIWSLSIFLVVSLEIFICGTLSQLFPGKFLKLIFTKADFRSTWKVLPLKLQIRALDLSL